jgi:hypothetical protein
MSQIIEEFEVSCQPIQHVMDTRHHEQMASSQKAFVNDVKSLVLAIDQLGKPFVEESGELLVLDSREIMHEEVSETVSHIGDIGKSQYQEYVKERLDDRSKRV